MKKNHNERTTLTAILIELKVIKNEVTELKTNKSALKTEQQTVIHMQQNQQKILERLSVRSIPHETDIAELRRMK
jgi:hypothetical protein